MWDDLSMREKSEFMKTAVLNGILDLDNIINKYNEFAKGGPIEEKLNSGGIPDIQYYNFFGEGSLMVTDENTQETPPSSSTNVEEESEPTKYLGLTADGWKDVAEGMIPIVGTINDYNAFMEEPTLMNGLGLGVSALTDAATLFGVGAAVKGAKALYKAWKAKEAISTARRIAAEEAADTYKRTKLRRTVGQATNKEVKSSILSVLAKNLNYLLARRKADFAKTLLWNYTKDEAKRLGKQVASPITYDGLMNLSQAYYR